MALPALKEQRQSPRILTKSLPGALVDSEQRVLQCRPLDLSPEGLAIVSHTLLKVGARIMLKTHKDSITLEVLWQKSDFGKRSLYRYGLKVVDPAVDLEAIFRESRCLKEE